MPLSFLPEQKKAWPWVIVAILLAFLVYRLGPVLSPFLAAAILAYALNPAVDLLTRQRFGSLRLPRSLATSIVLLILLAALLGLVLVVVPVMQKEFIQMREQIPALLTRLNDILRPHLHDFGIHLALDGASIQKLLTQQFSSSSEEIWATVLSSARVGGIALMGWIVTFALIPIALFYLLMDWHAVLHRIGSMVPPRWLPQTLKLAHEVDVLLAQYLRGQIAVMITLALYYSIGLTLVGLDVALPVGIITGLLIFVPYVGFGLGLVMALLAAVLQYDSLQGIMAVGAIYGAGQILEGFFLTPKLVGKRIGLHPLTVIFALLAFGQLFGFVGVLLALPTTAVLSVATKHLRALYLESSFYNQT